MPTAETPSRANFTSGVRTIHKTIFIPCSLEDDSCASSNAQGAFKRLELALANRCHFLHKRTAALVNVLAFIAAQVLAVKNITAGGDARKKALNREILATFPALFIQMMRARVEEAELAWLRPPRPVKSRLLGRDENADDAEVALSASGREPVWRDRRSGPVEGRSWSRCSGGAVHSTSLAETGVAPRA
ncbi:MAG TPA: hypothetical protein VMK12_01325 [Anaeromyxobacteraceae bacterium]|nr:hypothetical protein [Anaeromyxobacteraceae bacterium]